MKIIGALAVYHAKKEENIEWILRIFFFNNKNRLYLPIISTL